MKKYPKIAFTLLFFCGIFFFAFGDRGGFLKKNKSRINITTHGTLKNSIAFNLKSGLVFRGSFFFNRQMIGNSMVSDAYISYQKGNTFYVIPYKQRIVIPEYSQKEGYKLIIRSRK
jgi:hypothetical protein